MRKKYRKVPNTRNHRLSGKVVLISVTVGVLAAGTGISLAATQGTSADSVTCIVVADAAAAADANSALSDVFAVGTGLHLTSGGRAVDVKVSAPLTAKAAAPAAPTVAPTAAGNGNGNGKAAGNNGNNNGKNNGKNNGNNNNGKNNNGNQNGAANQNGGNNNGKNNGKNNGAGQQQNGKASANPADTSKAIANLSKVSVKAADNKGVNPNTVCAKLSTGAFNTLGGVGNGNNVGAFIATMTPAAANGNANNNGGNANNNGGNANNGKGNNNNGNNNNGKGNNNGNGAGATTAPAAAGATASPTGGASASANPAQTGKHRHHHKKKA